MELGHLYGGVDMAAVAGGEAAIPHLEEILKFSVKKLVFV